MGMRRERYLLEDHLARLLWDEGCIVPVIFSMCKLHRRFSLISISGVKSGLMCTVGRHSKMMKVMMLQLQTSTTEKTQSLKATKTLFSLFRSEIYQERRERWKCPENPRSQTPDIYSPPTEQKSCKLNPNVKVSGER